MKTLPTEVKRVMEKLIAQFEQQAAKARAAEYSAAAQAYDHAAAEVRDALAELEGWL